MKNIVDSGATVGYIYIIHNKRGQAAEQGDQMISKAHKEADSRYAKLESFIYANHGYIAGGSEPFRAFVSANYPQLAPVLNGLKCSALNELTK